VKLSLDANLLVYFVDRGAGDRHEQALELVRRASHTDCVLTLQSLGEFFHVATRKGKVAPADAAAVVQSFCATFTVVAAGREVLDGALSAVLQHGLSFWDAMLWSTVEQAGCELLLSEDFQDGRRLGRVTFVNPFTPDNRELLERALPPV
jgi:predicted nucleic acid-binding protein